MNRTRRNFVAVLLILCGSVLLVRAAQRGYLAFFDSDESHHVEQADAFVLEPETATSERSDRHYAFHGDVRGEVMIDRTFTVGEGDQFFVDVAHTDLIIETGSDKEAHIQVLVDASDMEDGREFYERLNFEVDQQGNKVMVETNPRNNRWNWNKGRVKIVVLARIPSTFDTDLTTSHGNVQLASLRGPMKIRTSHGNVETEALEGPMLVLHTSHGDVKMASATARDIEIRTSHGDVSIDRARADALDITTSHGDIELGPVSGRLDITNSHGDIDLTMDDVSASYLRTSHGNITVSMANTASADLDVRADRVRLASSFRFDGELEKDRAVGQLNGGGSRFEARTSHGNVELRGM